MPELPEVETTRLALLPYLQQQQIQRVVIRNTQLRWPVDKHLKQWLKQQILLTIQRRGKYLLFQFSNGTMLVHLGMSGSLRLVLPGEPLRKHDHISWFFSDYCLRYHDPRRFGSVHWTTAEPDTHPLLQDLGVEPLANTFSGQTLFQQTQTRKSPIKQVIMNANIVVGVGNIYANEALFKAGIHPLHPAAQLDLADCKRLARAIRQILRAAIKQGGTTLRDFVNGHGEPGYFRQQLQVYERANQPCRKCGSGIQLLRLGQRASYFCPNCQPAYRDQT